MPSALAAHTEVGPIMAVMRALTLSLFVGVSVVCGAKEKIDAGKSCFAKSCNADGDCEDKTCSMLDAAGESAPATRGKILSCQG